MQYFDLTGSYADAWADVKENGGQLYPGNGKDSASVVVRGKQCFTYWPPQSKRRQEVKELCEFFRLESYGMTGGRIARYLIDDILAVPYGQTFWQKRWRSVAVKGEHWHYYSITPYQRFMGIEVDVKSAYVSSLFAAKSLLFQEKEGFLEDNNALENLRELTPFLPKWFRLQLLGCLASWKFSFLCQDKKNPDNPNLVMKQCRKITYGAAFNCVHRAIMRNYQIMRKIHTIGGEFIKRMHTDSFFLDMNCPASVEIDIFNYLEDKGLKTDIKASGEAFFFDLNCGFIGKKFVGSKLDVAEKMRSNGVKMKATNYPSGVLDRFGHLIESSSMKTDKTEEYQSTETELRQLDLFVA